MSDAPPAVPEKSGSATRRRRKAVGLPLWMPLLGLLIAFVFAVVAGIMICPTLSALALPPDPPLPPAIKTTLAKQENKGSGLDEYLYTTDSPGCDVARFYDDRLGDCSYDPDSGCKVPSHLPLDPGYSYQVAVCRGSQPIGVYHVFWTVYIGTNYKPGPFTQFRVIREIGN